MPEAATGPTLTNITHYGRLIVKFGLIALVTLMVGRVTLNAMVAYWRAANPPPPPPPTVGFGLLPQLRFSDQVSFAKPSSYSLETATGSTPDFGDRAKVFLVIKSAPNLLADQNAKAIASTLGFVFEPNILDSRNYRWTRSQPLESTLAMDIRTLFFTITTNYLSRPDLLVDKKLPSDFEAVNLTKNLLRTANLLPDDVATASGEVVYLKVGGNELVSALSPSDADFIQVDLNRFPIDGQYRMFTPEGYKGTINALIGGAFGGPQSIVHYEHFYNPIDYSFYHTYPLRTSRSAWQILQAGEGYIVNPGKSERVVVRTVTLGYYDDFEEQDYLQPIYVFENPEDGFMAYVSAIDPRYLQANP
jgi:hypothetical protein